jgi:hypothetical protein
MHRALPVSKGGADDESNWELSCKRCNGDKGTLTVDELFERMTSARAFRARLADREVSVA